MVEPFTAIIQARMTSERLPCKVLKLLFDKTVLGHIITRIKHSIYTDKIIVATSTDTTDDLIQSECEKYKVVCYRGSLDNVLERFYDAAIANNVTRIVRICGDNLFFDYKILDSMIEMYSKGDYDYLKAVNVPLGITGELFPFSELQRAYDSATENYQKEHVTPFIIETAKNKNAYEYKNDYSKYRLTLDTEADWILVNELYKRLYRGNHDFLIEDVIRVFEQKPDLIKINKDVVQRPIKY